jgi:hypothetical protein
MDHEASALQAYIANRRVHDDMMALKTEKSRTCKNEQEVKAKRIINFSIVLSQSKYN